MGYTLYDADHNLKEIRLLGVGENGLPEWKQAFRPKHWTNDACNPSSKRWIVVHPSGIEVHYAWYEVSVVGEESLEEMVTKMTFAHEVAQAREAVREAQKRLFDLVGRE